MSPYDAPRYTPWRIRRARCPIPPFIADTTGGHPRSVHLILTAIHRPGPGPDPAGRLAPA